MPTVSESKSLRDSIPRAPQPRMPAAVQARQFNHPRWSWARRRGVRRTLIAAYLLTLAGLATVGWIDTLQGGQPVLDQLAGPEAQAEATEAAAGVNRRQLPVIADQDHLGPGLFCVLEEAGELAAADHAGLIDHQHGAGVQLLPPSVEVAEEAVAGGHVLEPLALKAHGGDPGRGRGQEPVAVQLPGMPSDAQGESLAGPRSPHDQGKPLAALAQVTHHRPLIRSGGPMRGQGLAHRLMGDHGRLLARPASGARDQPLLDGQQVGSRPAALLQGPVGDHADRPLGQEPVGQRLQLGPSGPGQAGTEGDQDVGTGESGRVLGQPVRTGQPVEQPTGYRIGHRLVLAAVGCPAGHRPDQGVRVVSALSGLGPPASVQAVQGLMLLGLAGGLDGPLDQPRCPLPTVRPEPVELGVDLAGALGKGTHQVLGHPLELAVAMAVGHRPLHPQCPDEFPLVRGPIDGVGGQPMPIQVPAVQGRPASVRPLDAVGDDQVRMEQGVAFSGRPVVEPDSQHPLSGHMLDTAMAAAGAQVLVQIADRIG